MAITVLMGFDEPAFEKNLERYFRQKGYEVKIAVKLTKAAVADFLRANADCRTVILKEVNENAKYTADELANLTDEKELNLVVVLNDRHKGTEYMEILYRAGITSAVFQSGRKRGVAVRDVAELAIHKRSRREAREYYGLEDKTIELGFLGSDTFVEFYSQLSSPEYGDSVLERFINVCRRMNGAQMGDFIRRLPDEIIDEIKKYEEFWTIISLLQKTGVDINIKRPRNVSIGLKNGDELSDMTYMIENRLSPTNNWMDRAEKDAKKSYRSINHRDTEKDEEVDLYKAAMGALFDDDEPAMDFEDKDVSADKDDEPVVDKKVENIHSAAQNLFDMDEYQRERMEDALKGPPFYTETKEIFDYPIRVSGTILTCET